MKLNRILKSQKKTNFIIFSPLALLTACTILFFLLIVFLPTRAGSMFKALNAKAASEPASGLINFALQPIQGLSLALTKQIAPISYQSFTDYQLISDINDVLAVNSNNNLVTKTGLTFPDSSFLIIPDTNMINNLNAQLLQGRSPGIGANNLAFFETEGKIAGLSFDQIATSLISPTSDSAAAIVFSSAGKTPILSLDTLHKKLVMTNSTGPSFLEFHDNSTGGHVSVGLLGTPEANLSYNMDYTTRIHKYYDSSKNATWFALNGTAWAIQYAPAKSTANDMWYGTGGNYSLLGIQATKQLIVGSDFSTYMAGGFDGRLTVPRNSGMPSITGGNSGDLVIDGHQTKGTAGVVILNNYNPGQVLLARGGGNIGLGISGLSAAEKVTLPSNGKMGWESSAGVVDTNLYRNSANSLKTDHSFTADGGVSSSLFRVGNNSLDGVEFSNIDGLDQQLLTSSSPKFYKLGIGTSPDPNLSLSISRLAQASNGEAIQRWSVSDDSNSLLQVINASSNNGYFVPALYSFHSSASFPSLTFYGRASADTGSVPIQVIDSRLASSALSKRPLLSIRNFGTDKVIFGADGDATFSGAISTSRITSNSGALELAPGNGSDLKVSLSSSGNFYVNNDQLFISSNTGNVGIGTSSPTSKMQIVGLPVYTDNASAVAGGLTPGALYRTGGDPDLIATVH